MNTRHTLSVQFRQHPRSIPVRIRILNRPVSQTQPPPLSSGTAGYAGTPRPPRNGAPPRITSSLESWFLLALALWLLQMQATAQLSLPPLWRWSNPLPHGATIVDQATVGPISVQVGERGQIFLSDDWYNWTLRDSGTPLAFRGATFFKGRLVIVGEAGSVMVADDPWSFQGILLGTTDWLESVAASEGRVIAVGDNAAVYSSTNALEWTRLTPGFSNWLRSVAYGGNLFVAVGEGGLVATAASGGMGGMTWQVRTNLPTELYRVAWMDDHFIAVGEGGQAFSSPSGVTWSLLSTGATRPLYAAAGSTNSHLIAGEDEARLSENGGLWADQLSQTLSAPAPEWTYYAGLWNSNYYLLAGRTGLCVDGVKTNDTSPTLWNELGPSVRTWLWGVERLPTHYVAVGDYGTILTSPNGIDWELELVPESITNSVLLGVGGSPDLFLAVGSQGTILWATNVFLWNAASTVPTVNDLQGVCFDGTQFVVSGGNGTILTSPTGTNWTLRSTPTSSFLMSVAPYPGGLVAVGEHGTILTSTNSGQDWQGQSSGTTNWLMQVRWLNNELVAVGQNGTILRSPDGIGWVECPSGTPAWLNAVDYLDGTWFTVGNLGAVLVSQDTTNWFNVGTLTRKSLYGLCIHGEQLVTVGTEGVILRSQLVPDPKPIRIEEYARVSGYDVFLFSGGVDQQFQLLSSTNMMEWTEGARLEFSDGSGTVLYAQEAEQPSGRVFYRTLRLR